MNCHRKVLQTDISYYSSIDSVISTLQNNTNFRYKVEEVSFQTAFRRVLAKDVIAKEAIPKYNVSHMDGYAVNSADIADASEASPAILRINRRLLLPSHMAKTALGRGEAWPISTGSYLPRGADAVVPIEDTSITENTFAEKDYQEKKNNHNHKELRQLQENYSKSIQEQYNKRDSSNRHQIHIKRALPRGAFVYHAGTEATKGEQLLSKGMVLRAQDVCMLATLKIWKVPVLAKPKIAIIPTGNELTDDISEISNGASTKHTKRKIFESNSFIVSKLIEDAGGIPYYGGIASDDLRAIARRIKHALELCDMVLTLGGSSMGRFDMVETAVNSLGKPGVIAHGIRVDRGRVTGAAIIEQKPIIILPGPIQGAVSGFIAVVFPLIKRMSGANCSCPSIVPAILTKDWQARKRFSDFKKVVYVSLVQDKSNNTTELLKASPLQAESESAKMLVKANGYIILPEAIISMTAGQKVNVSLLPGLSSC
jgi:molybdenum cofactor synthesis domain-containing protein